LTWQKIYAQAGYRTHTWYIDKHAGQVVTTTTPSNMAFGQKDQIHGKRQGLLDCLDIAKEV